MSEARRMVISQDPVERKNLALFQTPQRLVDAEVINTDAVVIELVDGKFIVHIKCKNDENKKRLKDLARLIFARCL